MHKFKLAYLDRGEVETITRDAETVDIDIDNGLVSLVDGDGLVVASVPLARLLYIKQAKPKPTDGDAAEPVTNGESPEPIFTPDELVKSCDVDAAHWANAFRHATNMLPDEEGFMLGWFANAIENGKNSILNQSPEVRDAVAQAVAAGSREEPEMYPEPPAIMSGIAFEGLVDRFRGITLSETQAHSLRAWIDSRTRS
jgi:hypothetical protein